jgi:Concanavalin A-like lectin/glucanases superfamily
MTVYLNANAISTSQAAVGTRGLICSSAELNIGGWWDGDPESINGELDEVRLYNRVLNADEIAALSKNFQ